MVKSAFNILNRNPFLFLNKPAEYDLWLKVTLQATRHTQRSDQDELHKISRPLEEDIFTQWRLDNRRHLTNAPISKMERMLISTTKRNGIGSISDIDDIFIEILSDWDFSKFGRVENFEDFKQKVLVNLSLEDPNALILDFPFNALNPDIAPVSELENGGLAENQPISSETLVIPSANRRYYDDHMVSWVGGRVDIGDAKKPNVQTFYYMLDDDAFWLAMPTLDDEENVIHKPIPWYTHSLGFVPFTMPPSVLKKQTLIDEVAGFSTSIFYRETYAWQVYEHLDQVVVDFSQAQVNRVRLSNAILVMNGDLECTTCHGKKTVMREYGSRGKTKKETCGGCGGSGKFSKIGQFSTIKVKEGEHSNTNPVGYVAPPTQIGDYSEGLWEKHIKLAEDAFSVDPLEGSPTEAVASKDMRMQPKAEMMNAYGDDLTTTCEAMIKNKLSILENEVLEVSLPRPHTYAVKSAIALREEVRTALPVQRRSKTLELVRLENMGDALTIKKWEIATKVCPEMLLTETEISSGVSAGAFEDTVFAKKEYIMSAMDDILEDEKNKGLTFKDYRELVHSWMIENCIFEDESVIPEDVEEEILPNDEEE